MDDVSRDRYIVPSLAQGLQVLSLFSRSRTKISAPEIVSELGLSRTTAFRILHTLATAGYICRDEGGRQFRLGPAALGNGFSYLASLDFVEVAQPVLRWLRDETGMSSHMAIRDGRDIVYVARYPANTTVRSSVTIGTRFAAHATVMGRMLLLDMSGDEFARLFPETSLPAFSEQTPATPAALQALIARDRERGFAVGLSFFERGVSSAAAPVRDAAGRIVAAINVTSVDGYSDPARLEGPVKDAVLKAARDISGWMSGDGTQDLDPSRQQA